MTTPALTRSQFAQRYGIHPNTVDRQRKGGDLRNRWFRIGRKIFILPLDEKAAAEARVK